MARPTRIRYNILALTVAAYMITYIDRVVISSAVPSIQKEFGFSIVTMGWILSSFQWAYAIFQIPGGWLGDRIGPRRALALIVTWWSAFTCATIFAWSAVSMAVIRFLFGMGEAGAFPIATRSLSRWMLPTERGFAQGATHAGSRLGGAITPALVVLIIARWGWRSAFLCCGALGICWAALWFWYYRDTPEEHSSVNPEERELIRSSLELARGAKTTQSVPWKRILSSPQMQLICAMYFCYAYNLSVYLVWFPKYLNDHRGFNLKQMGFYASMPLLAGTAGDVLGGWLSDLLARRFGNLKLARRIVGSGGFLLSAACMVPACLTRDALVSVWLSSVAMFAMELTVGVSWAITLDIGADSAGAVSAVMNTSGNLGGAISSALSGYLIKLSGWNAPFLVMAGLSLIAGAIYFRINASRRLQTA
ncbi:MAG TPA: MFS transporter [Acidobacteriaceae bacterium]|nr:MFS transporter [Acidobacteriaceae bacterium]